MDQLICAKGISFPRNQLNIPGPNDHCLVVGSSGRGKTSGFLDQNLINGGNGSIILSDPKGVLRRKYESIFQKRGYRIEVLDFMDMKNSSGFNPFLYAQTETDVMDLANALVYMNQEKCGSEKDPYWDTSAEFLLYALIHLMIKQNTDSMNRNFATLADLIVRSGTGAHSLLVDMENLQAERSAIRKFKIFYSTPERTKECTRATAYAKIETMDIKEILSLTSDRKRHMIDIPKIGQTPTIVFVCVPDTNRSMDILASLFFMQCIHILCREADKNSNGHLKCDVRLMMDDFASTVVLQNFPDYIAQIRGRGIASYLMVQSYAQLEHLYKENARTIIDNCDTQIYMGGNDIETAERIARRCNIPVEHVLSLSFGQNILMRTGQKHQFVHSFQPYEALKQLQASQVIDFEQERAS